ncbi:MAG: hypothetical protein ACLRM8_00705 [Alistipes sp.]
MNAGNPNLRQIYNDGYYLSKLLSFYGRINYSLKDKYLLTATMRADGSTKFGKTTSGATSGAVSWKMHNEPWLKQSRWLSELKLRLSYGASGNQGISSYQTSTATAWRNSGTTRVGDRDRPRLRGGPHRRQQPVHGMGRHRQSGPEVGIDLAARFRRRFRSLRPSPAADRRRLLQKTTDLLRENTCPCRRATTKYGSTTAK